MVVFIHQCWNQGLSFWMEIWGNQLGFLGERCNPPLNRVQGWSSWKFLVYEGLKTLKHGFVGPNLKENFPMIYLTFTTVLSQPNIPGQYTNSWPCKIPPSVESCSQLHLFWSTGLTKRSNPCRELQSYKYRGIHWSTHRKLSLQ